MGVKQSGRLFQPEPRNLKAKLFNQVIIRTKHIHSNNFHSTSDCSIVAKKVVPDDSLCSSLKNSDDTEIIKILRNETHLAFLEAVFIPAHVFWKEVKVNLELEFFQCTNDGLIGDSQAFSAGRHRDFLD